MAEPLRLYPVILSGGSGSRLWPLSREEYPKQLQALISDRTLLQETALRVDASLDDGVAVQPPIVVCNEAHRFIVAEQLRAAGIEPKAVVIEPRGRNTAPAACVAALLLESEPDALMLIMPSDHSVKRPDVFREAIACAAPMARDGRLMTFGIRPTYPATAYGYIKAGAPLDGSGCFTVERFVEKPDAATAAGFLETGGYYWNGGIFLCSVGTYLAELARSEPDIIPGCRAALNQGRNDLFFFRLDDDAFQKVPSQSIDYGVMERTDKAGVAPVDMGWSDVGSWSALHDEAARDDTGNTLLGDVIALDSKDCYVRSEKQLTAVIGIKNAVVVVTDDAVLVADKAHDQRVKQLVEGLKSAGRSEATAHARTYRPWGWFQTMDEGGRFKVKRICVKPGAKLSLQKHWHRSEHWVIVTGTALVTRNEEELMLRENESTFIPAGTVHRLANPGQMELHMIEVQSGEYVGEDDIVRIADDYGRSEAPQKRVRPVLTPEQPQKPVPKAQAKAKAKAKAKLKIAKPHRKMRRKANPAAAARRRARRHPVRPPTRVATTRKVQGKPKPPGKPRRR